MTSKGVIHLDTTYFGRNIDIFLALESQTGILLYMKHIANKHVSDYENAVSHILSSGYEIKEIVIDGLQKFFDLSDYPIQMTRINLPQGLRHGRRNGMTS